MSEEVENLPSTEVLDNPFKRGEDRIAAKRNFSRNQFGPQGIELAYMRYLKDAYAPNAGVISEIYHNHKPGQRTARTVPILQLVSISGVSTDVVADQGTGSRVRLWDVYVKPHDEVSSDQILFSYVSEEDWVSFEAGIKALKMDWPEPEAQALEYLKKKAEAEAIANLPTSQVDPRDVELETLKNQLADTAERTAKTNKESTELAHRTRLDQFTLLELAQKLLERIKKRGEDKIVHYDLEALIEVFEATVPVLERATEQPIGRLYPELHDVKQIHVTGAAAAAFRVQLEDIEAEEKANGPSEPLTRQKDMLLRAMEDYTSQASGLFDD